MKNKQNLVSIIIPVYNCEKYIKKTIESVKEQTYKNWELVIVDDCSTDRSKDIIQEELKQIIEKSTLISLNINSGVAIARNIALKQAKGDIIAYLDGDDFWKKDKLEKQLDFMEKNKYAFSFTSYSYFKNNSYREIGKIPEKLIFKESLKNTVILTSTVMIDISKIDKSLLEMPNIRRGQDTATWWNILKKGNIAYGLNENLTFYRKEGTTLSSNKFKAIKRTWNLYRNIENMTILKSIYYFLFYAINAVIRRMKIKKYNIRKVKEY